jgi:hypothetical protein
MAKKFNPVYLIKKGGQTQSLFSIAFTFFTTYRSPENSFIKAAIPAYLSYTEAILCESCTHCPDKFQQ